MEEANQLMADAASLPEFGGGNVSQVINYAFRLADQELYRDALDQVNAIAETDASDFGLMFIWSISACAHHALGDEAARDDNLARLRENWTDNGWAYQDALMCTGQTEAAAAFLIERINDPNERDSALSGLQRIAPYFENTPLAKHALDDHAFKALADREDVRRAVDAHGRILAYDGVYLIGSGL